ncbi:MAG: DUF3137 domain-containing protein [Oscillospiraceae bacterium]|nr:DUF3137 domain-containing protein [Oscillospiraceae bacterium]
MKCQNCGSSIPDNAMFCSECGSKVGSADQASVSGTSQSGLEDEFKLLKSKAKQSVIIMVILGLISLLALVITQSPIITILLIVSIFIYAVVAGNKNISALRNFHSEKIVRSALSEVFNDLIYDKKRYIDGNTIENCRIMPFGWDKMQGSDYVSGKYKDISFVQSDISLIHVSTTTDAQGHTHTTEETRFKGRYAIFDFNKQFATDLIVRENGFGGTLFSSIGRAFSFDNKQKVEMESVEFNKKFEVYAADPHNAFYILTPQLMERIQKSESENKGRIYLCFTQGKLHVAVDNREDAFEMNIVSNESISEMRQKAFSDIATFTELVDTILSPSGSDTSYTPSAFASDIK